MLWTPTPRLTGVVQSTLPGTVDTTPGVDVTGSATPNDPGAWTEIFSSTNFDVHYLEIYPHDTAVTNIMLDFGVGGSGSEVLTIDSLLVGWIAGNRPVLYRLPIFIPKSTRVVARARSGGANTVRVVVWAYGRQGGVGQWHGITKWDEIGIDKTTTRGTSITSGNGSYGSWTSVGSTTGKAYKAIFGLVNGLSSGAVMNDKTYHFDFGFNSTALVTTLHETFTNETITICPAGVHFERIPSGTQMQARGICDSAPQDLQVALYGGY